MHTMFEQDWTRTLTVDVENVKSLRQTDDGQIAIAIAHKRLWLRLANKKLNREFTHAH